VLSKYPVFQKNKFVIFSESYGGKMASSFGKALFDAIKAKSITCNFGGVALGDSWINPMSFVKNWAPYLWTTAEVDWNGYNSISKAANMTQAAVDQKKWTTATDLWGVTEAAVQICTDGINFYNILQRGISETKEKVFGPLRYLRATGGDGLDALMNGEIKKKLNIPNNVYWGGQSNNVFQYLYEDFMQDVTGTVDYLLNNGVTVVIYTGNLDLICCSTGTFDWMNNLKWSGMYNWLNSRRDSIYDPSSMIVGFEKTYKNLRVFTILDAGHMIPTDQPIAAEIMLNSVLKG